MHKSTGPRVTIGLPVYNGAKYLRAAIDSILDQTFRDLELIISDNGSSDDTQAICRAYAAADERVRYLRYEENRGATWNYNNVVVPARGQYFRWAAHDDICAPELLERCVAALDQMPAAVLVYTGTIDIDAQGRELSRYHDGLGLRSPRPAERYARYHAGLRGGRMINVAFGMMRLDALRQTKLIGNFVASDEILLAEMALRGEFYEITEYLFYRRNHVEQSVRANMAMKDRIVWFDPRMRGRLQLPRWRWLYEYVDSIRRVPLTPGERLRCLAELGPWAVHNRRGLLKDLAVTALWPARALVAGARAGTPKKRALQ